MISDKDIPLLPRGVRLHRDKVRQIDVLLGPERVVMLDPIGKKILGHMDGKTDIACMSASLSREYDAPVDVIAPDVVAFVQDLVEKGFVHVASR